MRDRLQIFQYAEREAAHNIGADRQRADRRITYGVTVGYRTRDQFHAYHQRAAGTVVHHHLLLQLLHKFRADQPRDGIGRAARRLRHDQPDRPVRKIRRHRRARE